MAQRPTPDGHRVLDGLDADPTRSRQTPDGGKGVGQASVDAIGVDDAFHSVACACRPQGACERVRA
jgi:hypothetical protein